MVICGRKESQMTETILYHKHDEEDEIIIKLHGDADMPTMIDAFRRFLLAISFSPATVNEYLGDEWFTTTFTTWH